MVRPCAVRDCPHKDSTILSHRFPRKRGQALVWQNTLDIEHINIEDLLNKYVVCTKHFELADYRSEASNFLNTTAIPKRSPQTCKINEHHHDAGSDILQPPFDSTVQVFMDSVDNLESIDVPNDTVSNMSLNLEDVNLVESNDFEFIANENCIIEEVVSDTNESIDGPGIETYGKNEVPVMHTDEITAKLNIFFTTRDSIRNSEEKLRLSRMTQAELIDELLIARRLVEDLWDKLKLHESVRANMEKSLALLK